MENEKVFAMSFSKVYGLLILSRKGIPWENSIQNGFVYIYG